MKKLLMSVACLSLLGLASCKKEDKKPAGLTGKPGILTTGKWQLSAQTYQNFEGSTADPIEDRFKDIEDCEKDDFLTFRTDKVMMINEGATKCDSSDFQEYSPGNWELTENETVLRQSGFGGVEDWVIEQLDDNTFKFSYTFVDVDRRQKSTLTYKHIN